MNWPIAVSRWLEREDTVVRVLVAEVRGSAPREAGACMFVSRAGIEGSIGGGNLEWHAIAAARDLLAASAPVGSVNQPLGVLRRLTLGPELAQCCGGVVQLWIERLTRADLPFLRRAALAANEAAPLSLVTQTTPNGVSRSIARESAVPRGSSARAGASGGPSARARITTASDGTVSIVERLDNVHTPVWLYGAGHTGQAVVRALTDLPFQITWIDSRAELFPHELPPTLRTLGDPLSAANCAPRAARHFVMTHDHGLDYDICRAILQRDEFAGLGLIGSESKAARFRSRLRRDGIAPEQVTRLVCPIGLTEIRSKLPAAIAIGIAAQLLRDTCANPAVRLPDAPSNVDCSSAAACASCDRSHR